MKAITNNYSKLLASGFLANAKQELRLAQTTLLSPLEDEYDDYEDFYWSFDLAARKTEFDFYFDELGVGKFVANRIDFFLKKKMLQLRYILQTDIFTVVTVKKLLKKWQTTTTKHSA